MNPFDDPEATFLVLVNALGQHSLWPAFRPAPSGWTRVFGPGSRDAALDHVERHWPNIAPVHSR